MTSDTDLERLAALHEAAMAGPWSVAPACERPATSKGRMIEIVAPDPGDPKEPWSVGTAYICCGYDREHAEENAQLIALMRNSLPDLLLAARLVRDLGEDGRAAAEALRYRRALEAVLAAGDGRSPDIVVAALMQQIARNALEDKP